MWKDMGGDKREEFCVYVQGMHIYICDGFGEISGMADGEGCQTAI